MTQDAVEAYKWLYVATIRAEGERATSFDSDRRALANQLTPAQLAEDQKRGLAWLKALAARDQPPA